MLTCETTNFGCIEYSADSAVEFEEGLPGFEAERRFVVIQQPQHYPLVFLQSVATSALCFPALPVRVVDPQYDVSIADSDRQVLGIIGELRLGENTIALALIAIHEDPTANLLAPVVINLQTRAAAQCIDPGMRYSHRYPLAAALQAAS
jgi:flagellar assembly factor FliW